MSNSAPQELEVELLSSVTLEDVQKIELEPVHVKPLIPVDQELLQTALVELDQLVGIEKVKKKPVNWFGLFNLQENQVKKF